MPTYEYRCPNGHDFEHFYRKMSDATSELPCPTCGAVAARQVSGGAGLLFKGAGFYLTDYGKNAHRKGSDSARGGDSASSNKSDVKSGDSSLAGSSNSGNSSGSSGSGSSSGSSSGTSKSDSSSGGASAGGSNAPKSGGSGGSSGSGSGKSDK